MNKKIALIVLGLAALVLTACGTQEQEPPTPAVNSGYVAPPAADSTLVTTARWDAELTLAINTAKASERLTGSSPMAIQLPSSGKAYPDDPIRVSVAANGEQITVYDYGQKAAVRFVAFYTLKDQMRKTTYTTEQVTESLREQSTSYSDTSETAKTRHAEAQQLFARLTSQINPPTS